MPSSPKMFTHLDSFGLEKTRYSENITMKCVSLPEAPFPPFSLDGAGRYPNMTGIAKRYNQVTLLLYCIHTIKQAKV